MIVSLALLIYCSFFFSASLFYNVILSVIISLILSATLLYMPIVLNNNQLLKLLFTLPEVLPLPGLDCLVSPPCSCFYFF